MKTKLYVWGAILGIAMLGAGFDLDKGGIRTAADETPPQSGGLVSPDPTIYGNPSIMPNDGPRKKECDDRAKTIARSLKFERQYGPRYFFELPHDGQLTLYCAADLDADSDGVEAVERGRSASDSLYTLTSKAASVLGGNEERLQQLSRACLARAAKTKRQGWTFERGPVVTVSCTAEETRHDLRFRLTPP